VIVASLVGDLINRNTYIYSSLTNSWASSGMKIYPDQSDEKGWAKLGNGTVLNYDLFESAAKGESYAEIYNPATGAWSSISPSDGSTHGAIPRLSGASIGFELGLVLRLQDGRMIVIGEPNTPRFTILSQTPGPPARTLWGR